MDDDDRRHSISVRSNPTDDWTRPPREFHHASASASLVGALHGSRRHPRLVLSRSGGVVIPMRWARWLLRWFLALFGEVPRGTIQSAAPPSRALEPYRTPVPEPPPRDEDVWEAWNQEHQRAQAFTQEEEEVDEEGEEIRRER